MENIEKYFDGYPGIQGLSPEELLDMGRRFDIPNSMYFDDLARQWLNGLGPRLSAMEDENGDALEPFNNAIQTMIDKGVDFDSLERHGRVHAGRHAAAPAGGR